MRLLQNCEPGRQEESESGACECAEGLCRGGEADQKIGSLDR